MRRVLFISFISMLLLSCSSSVEKAENSLIDKEMWQNNSQYRYKVASEFDLEELIKDKPESEVINILGAPDIRVDSSLIYYLNIPKNKSEFKGSRLIINPVGNYPFRTIVINVEPAPRKEAGTKTKE